MTRSELIRAVRARGEKVAPHIVEYLIGLGRLEPPPRLDGSHRRIFDAAHVDQVAAHVRRRRKAG